MHGLYYTLVVNHVFKDKHWFLNLYLDRRETEKEKRRAFEAAFDNLGWMLGTFSHQLLSTSFDFQAEQLNCAEDGGLNFKPQSSEQTNPVLAVLSSTDLRVLEHDANEANHEN